MQISELIAESHRTAVEKGWWEGERDFAEQVANYHAELSEAWEEYRKYGLTENRFMYVENGKPEGIAVELADVLIRIADTCGRYGIDIEAAIRAKLDYNKTRSYRHGGKKA